MSEAMRRGCAFTLLLASSAAVGCGGKSENPVGVSDAGAGAGNDASDDSSTTSSHDAAIDAYVCVDIDLSTYDQTCQVTSDCVDVNGGEVCTGSCGCGGALINKSGEARYEAATKGLFTGDCPCIAEPYACDHGKCTFCPFGPGDAGCAQQTN